MGIFLRGPADGFFPGPVGMIPEVFFVKLYTLCSHDGGSVVTPARKGFVTVR